MLKPILFNTEMVRAILDGRKTVTRRVINPQPTHHYRENCECKGYFDMGGNEWACMQCGGEVEPITGKSKMKSPYQKGDYLYVRETWGSWTYDKFGDIVTDRYYRADYPDGARTCEFDCNGKRIDGTFLPIWRPSIHMPKEAARLFLRVTDVRAERLQDISPFDAHDEGIAFRPFNSDYPCFKEWLIKDYRELWDHTIQKQNLDRYGWEANPWVWVIKFERVNGDG